MVRLDRHVARERAHIERSERRYQVCFSNDRHSRPRKSTVAAPQRIRKCLTEVLVSPKCVASEFAVQNTGTMLGPCTWRIALILLVSFLALTSPTSSQVVHGVESGYEFNDEHVHSLCMGMVRSIASISSVRRNFSRHACSCSFSATRLEDSCRRSNSHSPTVVR